MFTNKSHYENQLPSVVPDELSCIENHLRMYSDDKIEVWYAPLGTPVGNPKIWILGLTPGWAQMQEAYKQAAIQMASGMSSSEAAKAKKPTVAFKGPMRKNLVSMLDELGIAKSMNVSTSDKLFGTEYLRTGSVLKYPVFKNGKNYSGAAPKPLKHTALKSMVDEVLATEIDAVDDCLIVPLGTAVDEVLNYFVQNNKLDPSRILSGFPHPSGGNGYRVKYFNERKERLARTSEDWFSAETV